MQQVQQVLPEIMRAWRATRFGGIDALSCENTPIPLLYGDEVLVEVQAAALNPVDLKTLHGHYPAVAQHDLPFTLGRDVAGVIAQGSQRASGWEPGTRVCAFVGQGPGALADFVAVSASALANAPRAANMETAAAIPLAARTAWQGLFDQGAIKVEVAERFNFSAVDEAFERLERGHPHGKLVAMVQWHQPI
jgi:NADPH:quinone reductase-like Zn-dependent oxidoreductase